MCTLLVGPRVCLTPSPLSPGRIVLSTPRLPSSILPNFICLCSGVQVYELQALDKEEAELEVHTRHDWLQDDLRSVP